MICIHILLITFLNESDLTFLHAVKWLQVVQSNTNNSIYKVKWFQVLLCNSNNLTSLFCLHTFR